MGLIGWPNSRREGSGMEGRSWRLVGAMAEPTAAPSLARDLVTEHVNSSWSCLSK